MCKHDVSHKTGSNSISQEYRDPARVIGNTHNEFGEDRMCISGDMLADRQTDRRKLAHRHAHHNTNILLPSEYRRNRLLMIIRGSSRLEYWRHAINIDEALVVMSNYAYVAARSSVSSP